MSDTAIVALIAVGITCLVSICGAVWFIARLQQNIMDRLTAAIDSQRTALSDTKESLRIYIDAKAEGQARSLEASTLAVNGRVDTLSNELRALDHAAATRKELRDSEERMRNVMDGLQNKMEQVRDAVMKFESVATKVDEVNHRLERLATRLDAANQAKAA